MSPPAPLQAEKRTRFRFIGMNVLAGWNGSLHGVEETDKLLMPMLFHAASDYGSVEDVERGEKRSHAVALVIMRHCPAFAGLERQSCVRSSAWIWLFSSMET